MPAKGLGALAPADRTAYEDQGFLVIRNALTSAHVKQLRAAIATACNVDLDRPETWYDLPAGRNGSVDLYHAQSQWDARQSETVYGAFSTVLQSTHLWVSIDRAKLQMPIPGGRETQNVESFIHWDVDLRRPQPEPMFQGVLCLSTASDHHGGFQCVPGFHREAQRMAGRKNWNPWTAAAHFGPRDIHVVKASAGDLIIWNSLLPHGAGKNYSDTPRVAQFVRMFPATEHKKDVVARRQSIWAHRHAPGGRCSLDSPGTRVTLTPLGRRLVGIDQWTTPLTDAVNGFATEN